jgi:PAS domain S-box-containing protein
MPSQAILASSYDYRLVGLSVLIAILASYAALDIGGRVTASSGQRRAIWLTCGAVAMGTGIWAMHYIGMLAYHLPVAIFYDWPTVLLSLLAAVLASATALFVVSRKEMGLLSIGTGGMVMGAGIAAMHYIGMEAMRLPAMCHYSAELVSLSVVLAVVISLVALWLTFHLRSEKDSTAWRRLLSAMLMGAAIPVMHYTGMAAATFTPLGNVPDLSHAVAISSIGILGIGSVSLLILGLTILTSFVDRRFSAQSLELRQSEHRYRQLVESAQVVLWRGAVSTAAFSYVNQEAEQLLGYPAARWTGTPGFWVDHLHLEDRAEVQRYCQAAARDLGPQRFEHRMIAADERVVWFRTSVCLVVPNDAGTVPGRERGHVGNHAGTEDRELVGVMTDITERKQAEEAAEAASRAKGELLAEIKRLNEQLKRENSRMSAELEVTQRLQQMMLPRAEDLRRIDHLDISGFMDPADEVGGDYYDVVSGDGRVAFGIGDVAGHGLESGVIAIMVQTAVRTLLASGPYEKRKFFEVLNRVIYGNIRQMNCDRMLTFSLLQYQDQWVTISGQHEEVLVVRNTGVLERHDTLNLGFPLGLEEDISSFIGETRVPLQSGDVMVVYTDGITEATNCAGIAYGVERLSEAVQASHRQPAGGICAAVLSSLREHTGGRNLLDDISLLVIKPK